MRSQIQRLGWLGGAASKVPRHSATLSHCVGGATSGYNFADELTTQQLPTPPLPSHHLGQARTTALFSTDLPCRIHDCPNRSF
jgi:hypothetical protein